MKMVDTNCCVCFTRKATIPVGAVDSNKETIITKLRKLVSEVIWKECFAICPQCLKTLDIVEEFWKTCLRSNSIRLEQEESESNGCISELCEEIGTENHETVLDENPEQTVSVTSGIYEIELNSKEHLYQHNTEIYNSEHPYENDSIVKIDEKTSEDKSGHDYFCQKCKDGFSSKSEYENHVKKHNVFICFHCNRPFKSKVMLAKHIKVKHDANKNDLNQPEDLNITDLKQISHESVTENSRSKTIKMYKCDKCEKSYKTEKVMMNHVITCDGIKRHSKMNFPTDFSKNECIECGRFYTTEKNLKAHMKQCKKNSNLSQRQDYRCYMCDVILKDSKDKFEHVLKEHNVNLNVDNTCQHCYKQFLSNESLQSHIAEEHDIIKTKKSYTERSYSCEVCSKVFGYVKEVIEHCVKNHQMDPKAVRPYLCDICCTRFTSSANIIQHKQYHEGERSHICSYCGKSFITKSDLTVHEYTHLNRRNYKCEICGRAFNTNKNLRSHKLVVHTDSSLWKYQCNLCDKKFPLKSGYDQHIRRHSGDKRFKCLICEKSFVSSSELGKHKTFHSDERAFKCSHCSKEYKDRRVYEVHLTKIHGIGNAKIPVRVKKFVCQICPLRFFDKQKLSRHMCTHTGIKPFLCNICEKRFSDKSYLKYHLKIVHNFIVEQSSDMSNV